jgi:hemerythrin-like domain-containing protein
MDLGSLAQLDRSHRRHDEVMGGLLAAARRLAAGRPDAGDVDAVHGAVAYFQRAVTRHFLDEEGSVFPRLSTRRPELAEQLAALSAEHPAQIALHNAIAEAASHLDGEPRPGAGKQLLELAERLAAQHKGHVEREDLLFADAHQALTGEDDTAILAEMETRRDRDDNSGPHRKHGRGGGRGGGGRGGGGGGGGRGGGGGPGQGRGDDRASEKPARITARHPAKAARKTTTKAALTTKAKAKKSSPGAKKPARRKR